MHIAQSRSLDGVQRLSITVLPAALITHIIILIMLSLITTDELQINEKQIRILPVVMPPPLPPEARREEPPAKPVDPLETPQWEPQQVSLEADTPSLSFSAPTDGFKPAKDKLEMSGGGGIVAYLKVEPIYPNRALSRGIEGFVDLSFDISAAGSTTNIRVIASEPEGVFDKAAIDALKKWKYKVPMEGGIATGQRDMMTRISFAIDA